MYRGTIKTVRWVYAPEMELGSSFPKMYRPGKLDVHYFFKRARFAGGRVGLGETG